MKISVRLFAGAREAAGGDAVEVELPAGSAATAGALLDALAADPRLASIARRSRLAVDRAFARADTPLAAGSEVALIPPVGGG